MPAEAGSPCRKGPAVRLSSEGACWRKCFGPRRSPACPLRAVVATAENGERNEKPGWMCGRILQTADIPRFTAPGGRFSARHCCIRDSDGRRDKLARPRLAAAERARDATAELGGPVRPRPPATGGSARSGRNRPAPNGRSSSGSRATTGRRARSARRGGANRSRSVAENGRAAEPASRTPAHALRPPVPATGLVRTPPLSRVLWVVRP